MSPAPEEAAEHARRRWYVTVPISAPELALCRRHAVASSLGGQSNVRTLREERRAELEIDQTVAQVVNLAGCKALFGMAAGHVQYRAIRWMADRNPSQGDGGFDVVGCRLDFKGSLIRNPERDLALYRLAVRPRERHPGTVYVLAVVPASLDVVHLLGWATDEELPDRPDAEGTFEGAFTVPATRLHRVPPLTWDI